MFVAALLVYVVMAVFLCIRSLDWSWGGDTGVFSQAILNAFHGMYDNLEGNYHYLWHWSPVLTLLWPLMALTRNPLAIQFVQLLAAVACAPLMYAIVRPRTTPQVAFRLSLLTLLYPPLIAQGFNEFHELGIFTPLVLGLVAAADRRRWGWFAACAVLVSFVREDACIVVAVAALALCAVGWRSRPAWALVALLQVASLAIYFGLVVPHYGSWGPGGIFYHYSFADGPIALLVAAPTHLREIAAILFAWPKITYVLGGLIPLAFLPFFSPWSLLAIPGFVEIMLSNQAIAYDMGRQYDNLWIAFLILGAAFAVVERKAVRWLSTALALTAGMLLVANPMHLGHYLRPNYHDLADASRALACVPRGASVATYDEWYAEIAAANDRATDATWNRPYGSPSAADFLVFAYDFPKGDWNNPAFLDGLVASGKYRQICRFGSVVTYQRNR